MVQSKACPWPLWASSFGKLYFKAIVKKPFLWSLSSHIHWIHYYHYLKRASRLNAQTERREQMAREFQFWFLQLFSVTLLESARWRLPPQSFLDLSCWKKTSTPDTWNKSVFGGKRLFVSYSWILLGTLGCKAPSELQGRSPRPWLSGLRAGLRGIQQSDWWQHHSSCQLSAEHKQKGTSCSLENHRIFMQIYSDVTATAKIIFKMFYDPRHL